MKIKGKHCVFVTASVLVRAQPLCGQAARFDRRKPAEFKQSDREPEKKTNNNKILPFTAFSRRRAAVAGFEKPKLQADALRQAGGLLVHPDAQPGEFTARNLSHIPMSCLHPKQHRALRLR